MTSSRFRDRFDEYNRWKERLYTVLGRYREWLEWHEIGGAEGIRRLTENIDMLKADHFTIAFVAEFSRGKSELINALFFAEQGRRLLPSAPGRTTMCPTELFYDDEAGGPAYVRLLPIETRAEERTIAELKLERDRWTTIELEVHCAERTQTALQELVRVKRVSLEEARRLGLYHDTEAEGGMVSEVEVPCWRHAMVSYPHPLLRQGLIILDTPGLNALGTEPELTLNMLPKSQAVLFVLGADTGVTRSDMDMWMHHVSRTTNRRAMIVVLNKIDTLWDDLREATQVQASIDRQREDVARTLGVPAEQIFPVSAQKGLVAKVKGDAALLASSHLVDLESFLSERLMAIRRSVVLENLHRDLEAMLQNTRGVVAARVDTVERELRELEALVEDRGERLRYLMLKMRQEQAVYLQRAERYQASRHRFRRQMEQATQASNIAKIDVFISSHRSEMRDRWTTFGLRSSMSALFEQFRETLAQIERLAAEATALVQSIYRAFEEDLGLKAQQPRVLRFSGPKVELEELFREAEHFRNSPVTTLIEQNYLIQKFFVVVVSRAREIFYRVDRDLQDWAKDVLNPLIKEMWRHKQDIKERMAVLRDISQSRERLSGRMEELREARLRYGQQIASLRALHDEFERVFATGPESYRDAATHRATA